MFSSYRFLFRLLALEIISLSNVPDRPLLISLFTLAIAHADIEILGLEPAERNAP
tara:strand:- start:9 stop:173 length:165 start_codon:yes stop_codon:yes gene_type:complete